MTARRYAAQRFQCRPRNQKPTATRPATTAPQDRGEPCARVTEPAGAERVAEARHHRVVGGLLGAAARDDRSRSGRGRGRERVGRLRRVELRLDDDALPRRVARVAGRERERRVGCRVEHAEVGRLHDLDLGDEVPERALHRRHDDLVARGRARRRGRTARRKSCGVPRSRRCRSGRAARCSGSGRGLCEGRRARLPRRRSCRHRSSGSGCVRVGRPP